MLQPPSRWLSDVFTKLNTLSMYDPAIELTPFSKNELKNYVYTQFCIWLVIVIATHNC